MNETKKKNTQDYFQSRIACFEKLARDLNSDNRGDEAVFAKVQMNVFDIFLTVFNVAVKTCGQDDGKVVQFFMTKLRQIPQSWHTALTNAESHGEWDKAHIERVKLESVAEIEKEFVKIWG